MGSQLSRRDLLRYGAGATLAAGVGGGAVGRLLSGAAGAAPARAATPGTGRLSDIDHIVVIIQENRSFDHYFGVRKGVRGFADPKPLMLSSGKPVFYQPGGTDDGYTLPFHFDSLHAQGQCSLDPGHGWTVQHSMVNGGLMDSFVARNGTQSMGYFTRKDIPWYYAIADHFTVCDAWFCSVLGPTNPNRYYSVTGTIDPEGKYGGGPAAFNGGYWYTWETYPERLQRAGISWRMYHQVDDYDDNILKFFRQYQGLPHTSPLWQNAMRNREVTDFVDDVANGELPQVSYVIAPAALSEHPSSTPLAGEQYVRRFVEAIAAHPKVWAKTAIVWTFDENGGFFDHVPPPMPEPGTPDEFVVSTGKFGKAQNIGLGVRVPAMVVSPWSTGGKVESTVYDHTSILQFIEARFGVEVPYLSKWRRDTCGDITEALDMTTPVAPFPTGLPDDQQLAQDVALSCADKPLNSVPSPQSMPTTEA